MARLFCLHSESGESSSVCTLGVFREVRPVQGNLRSLAVPSSDRVTLHGLYKTFTTEDKAVKVPTALYSADPPKSSSHIRIIASEKEKEI